MIFFTSDSHFGHANIIRYAGRPFNNVNEMDQVLIDNWNSVVTNKDIVYHLGDFSFGPAPLYLNQLNGTKYFVRGNHEKPLINAIGNKDIPYIRHLKIESYPQIVLCHYAMKVWDKSHFDSWHLYGHSHGTLENDGKSFDVGVDCHNFTPISVEQIAKIMDSRPDNFNYIKKLPGYTREEFEKARHEED